IPPLGERSAQERPIVVSIPLRPRMTQERDPRQCGGLGARIETEQGNATTETTSSEERGARPLPRGCAVASERPGATRATAAAADSTRSQEEGARRPAENRSERCVRDAVLRGCGLLRGCGDDRPVAARPDER